MSMIVMYYITMYCNVISYNTYYTKDKNLILCYFSIIMGLEDSNPRFGKSSLT